VRKLVRQEGIKDCGPASLAMIIKYYKGNISLDKLVDICKTGNNGTTAYHLIEAAKECGFRAYGLKVNIDEINDKLIFPCIAHVIIDNSYNHYVVIYKVDIKKKRMLIGDPIGKKYYLTFNEFEQISTNVFINLYPNRVIPFESEGNYIEFIKRIISSSKSQLIHIIILSLFITLFAIITTFYLQVMIDNVSFHNKLVLTLILFSIVYVLKIITELLRNKVLILVNQKVDLELEFNTFKQLVLLPYRYYRNHTTGELISRISDLKSVREIIGRVAISLFIDLPLTIISLIILFTINQTLGFIALIMLLLYFLTVITLKKTLEKSIDKCKTGQARLNSYMVEAIGGFESIKGCNVESQTIEKMEKDEIKLLSDVERLDSISNWQFFLKELINDSGFLIIIFIGTIMISKGEMTIGQLISFNTLLAYFLNPIRQVIDLDSYIKDAKIAINRIIKTVVKNQKSGIVDQQIKGDIVIKSLSYTYNDQVKILNDINLTIKEGNKVLLYGPSGSGKSTFLKILKGYYPIKRGCVYIGGIDICDYKQNDIVYISQNEVLFTDSIINNIGNNEQFLSLAKMCKVDEIVVNNNLGYNMIIEENGFNISGGQKQRIVLARALNNLSSILFIDEGLSQIDTNMERIILKSIFNHYKNKTIIIISHRLDNLDLFDEMIKLENGVMECATRGSN